MTAYRHLTQQLDVAPERIILAGRSLGSAVAVELATRVPSGGLLLLSAIDSRCTRRTTGWSRSTLLAHYSGGFPGRKAMLELSGGHNNVGFSGDESLTRALAQFWPNPG